MVNRKLFVIAGLIAVVILFAILLYRNQPSSDILKTVDERATKLAPEPKKSPAKEENTPPSSLNLMNQPATETPLTIDKTKNYSAVLITSKGPITVSLFAEMTPVTADNFVTLSEKGFYDNTIFHRVVNGFMIQGGDPKGDGTGGPGYEFADEPFEGNYERGTLAMANHGKDTNGSQFFIMHQTYPLPKNYVIFGKVTGGLEVVDQIATADVTNSASGERSKPVQPVKIEKIEIVEN